MSKRAALIASLAALGLVDGAWALESGRTSPLIGAAGFLAVAVLVAARREYRAGVIVGVAGIGIHAFELVFHGMRGLALFEGVLFVVNLCLSVVVAVTSWRLLHADT